MQQKKQYIETVTKSAKAIIFIIYFITVMLLIAMRGTSLITGPTSFMTIQFIFPAKSLVTIVTSERFFSTVKPLVSE